MCLLTPPQRKKEEKTVPVTQCAAAGNPQLAVLTNATIVILALLLHVETSLTTEYTGVVYESTAPNPTTYLVNSDAAQAANISDTTNQTFTGQSAVPTGNDNNVVGFAATTGTCPRGDGYERTSNTSSYLGGKTWV